MVRLGEVLCSLDREREGGGDQLGYPMSDVTREPLEPAVKTSLASSREMYLLFSLLRKLIHGSLRTSRRDNLYRVLLANTEICSFLFFLESFTF